MNRDLHEKLGTMEYEKLFAGMQPPALVKHGTIKHTDAKQELKRGTLLAKGADGKLFVCGGDVDETGTFSGTGNGSKTVFDLVSGGVVPAALTEVKVGGTATTAYTYNSTLGTITFDEAPANAATIAIKYTTGGGNPDCILCDDVEVGTTADENVAVYVSGCFNAAVLIMATGYTLSEADKDTLRMKGILLGTVQEP
jgi:hypothetical protein